MGSPGQEEEAETNSTPLLSTGDLSRVNGTRTELVETQQMKAVEEISGSTDLISINLSGRKFFILLRNFARFPQSRLGLMVRCSSAEDILKYCDKYTAGEVAEFYFDRTWKGFNDILDVYRVGQLHLNSSGTCANRLRQDLSFWNIHEFLLDPCCALRYYPALEAADKEIDGQTEQEQKYLERMEEEDFGQGTLGRVRSYLWNLTEYPETSVSARICAFTSMTVVIISTLTFVLSTMPELAEDIDVELFDSDNETTTATSGIRWEGGIRALKIVDNITMWFFTVEYIVRFICAPRKWRFFKAPLNVVDLLAILPYFVGFLVDELKDTAVIGRAGKVIRLIRVMRILRVFKLVRHFTGLQSLLSTLQQAYQELGLLMVLVWVIVLTISSLIYFAEKDGDRKWSFLDSFWWGLMALTTVGNGDRAPSTHVGKLIGGLCALIGVFILALPVPIVVNSFSSNYKNRVWRNEVLLKKQERSEKTKKDGTTATTEFTREQKLEKGCNGTKTL